MVKPIIKYNSGHPVAICNRCYCMMCFIVCSDNSCVITEHRYLNDKPFTSKKIGDEPPIYCDECYKLLTYTLNE